MLDNSLVTQFFSEIKRLDERRSGWKKIEAIQSISSHVLRAAQIGYVLARLEEYENPFEVVTLIVFHDNDETRPGDNDPLAKKYVKIDKERVVHDQVQCLGAIGESIFELWLRVEKKSDQAALIAKDADYLEMAVTAHEINHRRGTKQAQAWIEDAKRLLTTKSGKELLSLIEASNPDEWWQEAEKTYRT